MLVGVIIYTIAREKEIFGFQRCFKEPFLLKEFMRKMFSTNVFRLIDFEKR